MFLQIRSYHLTGIWKINNGVEFQFEKDGYTSQYQFSSVTLKFYHKDGKKVKLPKYLVKELLSIANGNGLVHLSEVDKENALYWV